MPTNLSQTPDYETLGWDTKDPQPFLSMIHPDMVEAFAQVDAAQVDPLLSLTTQAA